MSSDESASSENEEIGAQRYDPFQGHGSASGEVVPRDPQKLPSMQQLSLQQHDELAITTASSGGPALSNSGDNVITGGKFPDANFGPVTQHNKSIHKGNLTHIKTQNLHLHQHFSQDERRSDKPDEPSTSGSQTKQVRKKSNSGVESPETSMANITQTDSPLSIFLHRRALFHGTVDSPGGSYMTIPFGFVTQTLRDTEPGTWQFSAQTDTRKKEVVENESSETSIASRIQPPMNVRKKENTDLGGKKKSLWSRLKGGLFRNEKDIHIPGFIGKASGEPQTARGAQVMSSGQGHREEIGRGDTERESRRIFSTDMETRIKEVGGGESSETTRQRKDGSGFIETPGMFGFTMQRELLYWKDIEQLTSDPTVITKLPDSVWGYSVVTDDRCIYLVGKMTCYRYDLDNADRGWITLGLMKHDHGLYPPAAVLNGKLYVCGVGWGDASKKCEMFAGQWSETDPMKVSWMQNTIVSPGGFLYSIGGQGEKRNPLRSVEKYDPSTNKWEIIRPMNVARRDATAVVYNGKIYVWGGFARIDGWIASSECFDPLTSTWTLSTSDWWKSNEPCHPFVSDNKVLSLLWSEDGWYDTIQQVPLGNESEGDLIKVKLPERWKLLSIIAIE